jgi:hypothetical protein
VRSPDGGGGADSKEAIVEYRSIEQLAKYSGVTDAPAPQLTRLERLTRWAEALEKQPSRRLNTLRETEHQSIELRSAMRMPDSPIAVALADPVLRTSGLGDDTYGTAKKFFEVSDHQLHAILCYCRYGSTVPSKEAARAVRRVIAQAEARGVLGYLRRVLAF